MARTSLDERIERLEQQLKEAKARKKMIEARRRAIEARKNRRADTRRKILVGALILAKVERGEYPQEQLLAMLDQGWFEFRRQLDYKLAWRGGWLVVVPPQNTSRTCPQCGHVSAENRQTQARFECVGCGYENNADVVGAINILSRGMQIRGIKGGARPDGLWIEPHERSEAGTRRSVSLEAQ